MLASLKLNFSVENPEALPTSQRISYLLAVDRVALDRALLLLQAQSPKQPQWHHLECEECRASGATPKLLEPGVQVLIEDETQWQVGLDVGLSFEYCYVAMCN